MALVRLKNYWQPCNLIRSISSHAEEKSFGLNSSEKALESNPKYQFLQDSPVSSDYFQPSLFRLPIPKLEDSCARYLATQKQLLDKEQYLCTEEKVLAFLSNEGQQLHKKLVTRDKAQRETSYISGPWFDMYLKDRRPVSFTHNPGISLINDPRPEFNNTALRAANTIVSLLRFHKSLQSMKLYPDVFHMKPHETNNARFWSKVAWMPRPIATPLAYYLSVFPLDMSQFKNVLQSSRIPKKGQDIIQRFPHSKHLVVLHRGRIFSFEALDSEGNLREPSYYLSVINSILQQGEQGSKSQGIGALTSTDRDSWTIARERLVELGNGAVLEEIDSAIIALCLDDWEHNEESPERAVAELCCGSDPRNRWFDKSVSMIFSNNGLLGINFEHAWGDGVAVMRLCNEVIEDSLQNNFDFSVSEKTPQSSPPVKELIFNIDESIIAAIESARNDHLSRLDQVEFKGFLRPGFGKKQCKKAKIGPDAVMQLGFQLANLYRSGSFAPTYESCSTAAFRHGRTETVRPLTQEMRVCAQAFYEGKESRQGLLKLLQECSKAHSEMTKLAAQGKGWDRHFFALKLLAQEDGGQLPNIFVDEAYHDVNQIVLSTSTLSSANFGVGGFCPVTPKGFGLGYQIRDEELGSFVSVFKQHNQASDMTQALEMAFSKIATAAIES